MNLVSVGQSRPQIYWSPRFLCRISTETEWKAATDQVNSASEARKPTKKKKQQQEKKRRGHKRTSDNTTKYFELIISGARCLGRWRVGLWWVWHNPDPRTKLGEKACKVPREQRSQGNQCMVHYVLSPLSPPSTIHCYFILPYAIAHTNPIQAVSSISSLTMRPHVECLAAPSPVGALDYAR